MAQVALWNLSFMLKQTIKFTTCLLPAFLTVFTASSIHTISNIRLNFKSSVTRTRAYCRLSDVRQSRVQDTYGAVVAKRISLNLERIAEF